MGFVRLISTEKMSLNIRKWNGATHLPKSVVEKTNFAWQKSDKILGYHEEKEKTEHDDSN